MADASADTDVGRIPFRIRIGVAGHRHLRATPGLNEAVRQQVARVHELVSSSATPVRMTVVSQIAEGADRLVVREVFAESANHDEEAHLEVILPLQRDQYVESQGFRGPSLAEFEELLGSADVSTEPASTATPTGDERTTAYESAGHQVVARCDLLIALWDGQAAGGRGGTAETLLYASSRSKPCIWIPVHSDGEVTDNLGAESAPKFHRAVESGAALTRRPGWLTAPETAETLTSLRASFAALDRFNQESVPARYPRLREELASGTGVADWVAAPFLRATLLAWRWRARFQLASLGITLFAALAAVMLAISLSFGEAINLWPLLEAACFTLALGGLFIVRRLGIHNRWLSYRVLAERLRTAHFLAPTGADFRRQARLDTLYTGRNTEAWVMRAFEEVWDRRDRSSPHASSLGDEDLTNLKKWLADDWIGSQIRYHQKAARRHRFWHRCLAGSVFALFDATIIFAVLHSFHAAEDVSTFFSIALPAAGASLGVLLTVNQHQALSERYTKMQSDLSVVRRTLLDASAEGLEQASSEAARVVAQESSAWFGAMWFLNIEHP